MSHWEKFKKSANEYLELTKQYINNIRADKDERAEQCLKEFNKKGITLCHKDGTKATSEETQKITIERMDLTDEKLVDYCKEKFADYQLFPCTELVSQDTHSEL